MSTVNDIIKGSLRLIGVIGSADVPTAGEAADTLSALRAMMSSWSTEGLAVNKYTREVFALVAGQASYTMGPDGDFDTTRPVKVLFATAGDANIVELTPFIPGDPLALPDPIPDTPATYEVRTVYESEVEILNIQKWSDLNNKTTQGGLVQKIYVEGDSPLEVIKVWPVPSAQTALCLYSQKPLIDYDALVTEIELPPGYERAIRYNLACEIAPEFGRQIPAEVKETAIQSKANIKRQNSKPVYLKSDVFGLKNHLRGDIFSGS